MFHFQTFIINNLFNKRQKDPLLQKIKDECCFFMENSFAKENPVDNKASVSV